MSILRQDQNLLRTLCDGLPGVFFVIAADGCLSWWNQRWQTLTGLDAVQLKAADPFALFPPADGQALRAQMQHHSGGGQVYLETRLRRGDGWAPLALHGNRLRIDGLDHWAFIGTDLPGGAPHGVDAGAESKALRDNPQHSHELLRKLSVQVPGVIYQYRLFPDGRSCFPYASEAINDIYEVTPEQVREDASAVFAVLDSRDYQAIIASIEESALTLSPWRHEYRVVLPRQGLRWLQGDARPQRLADGSVLWHGFITDITERKRREEELLLASSVYHASAEAMMVTDAGNRIVAVNPAFTRITGYEPAEVIGQDPRLLRSGRQPPAFYQAMWQSLGSTGHWQGEIWNRRKNGEIYAEWLTINAIAGEDGSVYRYVALFFDITEKKRSDELIWEHANFDFLTRLPNRRLFRDRLHYALKKTRRRGLALALMFIDLDRFKEVNETLGHDVGDLLLVEAARRIGACVRESDTVARLGGDEFTVILPKLDHGNHAEQIAQEIIQALAKPFDLGGEVIYVSASVGITLYPADATEVEELIKNADQAMYVAKNQGRNCFSYFTRSMQEAARARLRLNHDLRGALAAGQFRLFFQPIVDLRSGGIFKAEALLRWEHPERGTVSPEQFIPLAEEVGLIHQIGDWVFQESARWALRWRQRGRPIQVSLNKSPVQLLAGHCHLHWGEFLREIGLPGEYIAIEITEGLLLKDRPDVAEKLREFRDLGVQVSIDDFGTGYSALSYLKKFDIDFVKIDRSFVRDLAIDPEDLVLSEAIIVMAHKLGLKVIAEGVETVEQRDLLTVAGCDYGQGYLYARPMPAEAFDEFLCGRSLRV